jgi:copper homeostasis protein
MPTLEIAVTSVADALQAEQGGAHTLEIMQDLLNGGLTPPLELARAVRDAVHLPLNVIVRPHARDFVYTPDEADVMLRDIAQLKPLGINSIVIGALKSDGHLDQALMGQFVEGAQPLPLTLHRALDVCVEPEKALESLIGVVPRVLTAGPAPTAWEGRAAMRRWIALYGQHFRFVSSGGLTLEQLSEYVATVKADEYHLGGAARTNGKVDSAQVQQLREVIEQVWR